MDKIKTQNLRLWFEDYICSLDVRSNEMCMSIKLKKDHTDRVCEEIVNLGRDIGMNEQDLLIAEIIALFHDIGRFEQIVHYDTFNDLRSSNHAHEGIRVLNEKKILDEFDQVTKGIIMYTVLHHNLPFLHTDGSDRGMFFLKLLRDADKLDIFRIITDYYSNAGNDNCRNADRHMRKFSDENSISDIVYSSVLNQEPVDYKHVKTVNEFKILNLGWVYDMNFLPAFRKIKERKYIDIIRDATSESEKVMEIAFRATDYISERFAKNYVELVVP